MSQSLWCDTGKHPFSSLDIEKRHFTQTREVEIPTLDYQGRATAKVRQEVTEELDICGVCWGNKNNPFSPQKDETADIEKRALEAERDMYKAQAEANSYRRPSAKGTVVE